MNPLTIIATVCGFSLMTGCANFAPSPTAQPTPQARAVPEAQIFGQKQVHFLTQEEIIQQTRRCKAARMEASPVDIMVSVGGQYVPETVEVKCYQGDEDAIVRAAPPTPDLRAPITVNVRTNNSLKSTPKTKFSNYTNGVKDYRAQPYYEEGTQVDGKIVHHDNVDE